MKYSEYNEIKESGQDDICMLVVAPCGTCQTGCQCSNQTYQCGTCQIGCQCTSQIGLCGICQAMCQCLSEGNQCGVCQTIQCGICQTTLCNICQDSCQCSSQGTQCGTCQTNCECSDQGGLCGACQNCECSIQNNLVQYKGTIESNGYGSNGNGNYINCLYNVTGDVDGVSAECLDSYGNVVDTGSNTIGYNNLGLGVTSVAFHNLTPNTTYTVKAIATYKGVTVATNTQTVKTELFIAATSMKINPVPALKVGESYPLTSTVIPSNTTQTAVIYVVRDKTILEYTSGERVKALKIGTTYVDAYVNANSNIKDTIRIDVVPTGTIESNGYGSNGNGNYINCFYNVTGDVDGVSAECLDSYGNIVDTGSNTIGYNNLGLGVTSVAFYNLTPNTTYTVKAIATYRGVKVATNTQTVQTPVSLEITKLEIDDIPDLGIGETHQLIPIFTPPNTSSKSVIYEITDKTIVDREIYDGNIKALKPGTTYIKASSSQRPSISVTKSVTVKPTGTILIENIKKTAVSISFDVITTGRINKIFAHSYDKEMEGQSKYTEDENHKIIERVTTGKTSIIFEGLEPDTDHKIEVDAAFNEYNVFDPNNKQNGAKYIIDSIRTDKFIPVTGINFDVPSIKTEQTVALKGEVIPYDATLNNITFSTDNTTTASVENGILKANKAGVCNIIATSKEYSRRKINCPSIKVSKKLIVQPGGTITLLPNPSINADSISLICKTTGDINKIKASCVNSSTNESQNPIEINANGQTPITFSNLKSNTDYKITAVAYMNTTILSSTITTIKTSIIDVTGITLQDVPTLSVGKSHTLIASVSPATATDKRIEFLTSNSTIATINNGVLTAKAAGSCTITARAVSKPNISTSKQLLITPVSTSNACTIDITSPGSGRQFDFLEDLMVKANISNSPDEVYFYYAASEDDISNSKCRKGTLKKLDNSSYEKNGEVFNTYFGYWRPLPSNSQTSRESEWVKGKLSKAVDDKYVWHMPKIIVEAVKEGGVSHASRPAYLHSLKLEDYKLYLKPNVDFNLERDIVGVATSYDGERPLHNYENTYNCLAYSVGIYNKWQEPFGDFSKSNLKKYMEQDITLYNGKKYGSVEIVDVSYGEGGEINNTNINFKARIIYYGRGHFAKVLTYDKNGNPKKIRSKWGIGELIDSPNPNPFADGYGNAKYLINSPAAIKEFNDYHKEDYNATDFIWDNVNKRYVDKDFYPLGISNSIIGMPIIDYRYQWLEDNKDSQNPLDKAIIQYCEESKLDTSLVRRAYYSPQDDKQLHIITDLGIQCVPEMLDEIKTKHPFSGLLMTAIEQITKISPELVDVSNAGINKWVANFNERISKAPYIVNDSISMLKQNTNNDTLDNVKESISSIGIISIPYIPNNTNVESVKLMEVLEGMYGENTISTYKNDSDNSILLENTVHKLYEQTQEPDLGNCKIMLYEPCRALGEAGYMGDM